MRGGRASARGVPGVLISEPAEAGHLNYLVILVTSAALASDKVASG